MKALQKQIRVKLEKTNLRKALIGIGVEEADFVCARKRDSEVKWIAHTDISYWRIGSKKNRMEHPAKQDLEKVSWAERILKARFYFNRT